MQDTIGGMQNMIVANHRKSNQKEKKTVTLPVLIKFSAITFGSTCVGVFTVIEIAQYFLKNSFFFSAFSTPTQVICYFVVVALITLISICFYIWSAYQTVLKNIALSVTGDNTDKSDSLVIILEKAYNEKRWHEVVKIGRPLSESLWYTGKYDLRVKIGEMIASAAGLCEEYAIQAETLLDDLGWTKIRLNEFELGKKNIEHGLKVANDHSLFYLIAKGYRHLADINLAEACNFWTLRYMDYGNKHLPKVITKTRELGECFAFYEKAISILPSIPNEKKRMEMEGNLKYTLAKYFLVKRDFDNALKAVEESQNLYKSISDKDREVKLYNLRGKIYMEIGRESDAEAAYQEGLRQATVISNNAHMVSNSISLAEYYLTQGQKKLARQMLCVSRDNSHAISDPILTARIEELSELLGKN